MRHPLDDFLAAAPDRSQEWARHFLGRMASGALRPVAPGLVADIPALARPFACLSGACTPGRRAPRTRSCCADLTVEPTPAERAALDAALPALTAWFGPGAGPFFDGDALARPGRRCAFAVDHGAGLRCGLVEAADAGALPSLRPLACRLFPLAIVALPNGTRALTAVGRGTDALLGTGAHRAFPCLGRPEDPPLAHAESALIASLFGAPAAARLRALVDAHRAEAAAAG